MLSLYPVVCPFPYSPREAVATPVGAGEEPFSFLALAPAQSLPFSSKNTKETIPATSTAYTAVHRGTVWLNNWGFSQEHTMQSLSHKATWVRVLLGLLRAGCFSVAVFCFCRWIFKGLSCSSFSREPH